MMTWQAMCTPPHLILGENAGAAHAGGGHGAGAQGRAARSMSTST